MSTTNNNPRSERDEIELMLPWYVAGTLAPHERQRVAEYLAKDESLRVQLALIEEDRAETLLANEALGAPSAGALSRLMKRIDAETPAKAGVAAVAADFWQKAGRFFEDLSPGAVRWAAVAAVLVIFVQAIALGGLMTGGIGGARYQTASGDRIAGAQAGTFVLVKFAETANAGQINGLLARSGARIVDGPTPDGMYRIRISDKDLSEAARDSAIEALGDNPNIVTMVLSAD